MAEGLQDLKQHLMATNDAFQRLATEHQAHKQKLNELASRTHLTDQEHLEEVRLKKIKLHLKDQMEAIMQHYRKQALSA